MEEKPNWKLIALFILLYLALIITLFYVYPIFCPRLTVGLN